MNLVEHLIYIYQMNFYKLCELVKNTSLPRTKLQWEYSSDTFKSWLMSEITKDLANDLTKWQRDNTENLPFKDLFPKGQIEIGDELKAEMYPTTRIVVPFTAAPEATSILNKIKQNGLNANFENGTITIPKKDKEIQMRLGKFVLDKKSPFSEDEKKWWIKSGNPIPELEATKNKEDYTIIVSRNPIDIARMSDHDGWTSCHAPHREYFQCAVADAKGAGVVGYVVKKKDLNKIHLQDPEIFGDKKRGIPGVNPISRLRLRKFVHKEDGYDLAVPENRMYGKQFPGMIDSLRDWALQKQLPKIEKYGTPEEWKNSLSGKQRPRMDDFQLMGGSYQDTKGSKLFNYMFGDDLDHGEADYGGEDEHQNMVDQMQEEVDLIERDYRHSFKICSFYASVEGDEGNNPFVYYSGTIDLSVPDEFMINSGPRTMGDTQEPDYWKKTKAITEAIRKWARDNDIYGINDIDINGGDVRINIYDEGGNNDPDSLRSFLNHDLSYIDRKADELNAGLYNLFVQLGLARQNKVNYISNNWDEHPHQFQNFEWEGEEPAVMVSIKNPISLPAPPNSTAGYQHEYSYWQEQFKKSLMAELTAWADKILAAKQSQRGLFQDPEFRYTPKPPFSKEFRITPEITLKQQQAGDPAKLQNVEMHMSIAFEPFSKDEDVNDAIDFISFLDKNYKNFTTLVGSVYYKWVGNWGKAQPQA